MQRKILISQHFGHYFAIYTLGFVSSILVSHRHIQNFQIKILNVHPSNHQNPVWTQEPLMINKEDDNAICQMIVIIIVIDEGYH